MKLISILLTVMILGSFWNPCDDQVEENEITQIEQTIQVDGEHDAEADLCSPFCSCHCCHCDFTVTFVPQLEPVMFGLASNTNYKLPFPKGYLSLVLQPPRA